MIPGAVRSATIARAETRAPTVLAASRALKAVGRVRREVVAAVKLRAAGDVQQVAEGDVSKAD